MEAGRRRIRKRPGMALSLLALLASPSSSYWLGPPGRPSSPKRGSLLVASQSSAREFRPTRMVAQSRETTDALTRTKAVSPSTGAVPLDRQIAALARKGQVDAALELFYSIPSPTLRQVNAAIDACGRSQEAQLQRAFDLLQEYCLIPSQTTRRDPNVDDDDNATAQTHSRLVRRSRRWPPNVYTFGALMSVCARAGNVPRALQVFSLLRDSKVAPNGVVYNAAIAACAKAERADKATELLQQAKESNVSVSVVGYNAAIAAAGRTKNWRMALELLQTMKEEGPEPDAVTYGTVMAACELGEQWDLVLEQAEEMKQVGGFSLDGLAIMSVLHACQQLGRWREALEYLELMKHAGTYERKTAGFQVAGNKQPLRGPDAVAYRMAISACARGGAWRESLHLLDEYCGLHDGGDVMAYTSAIAGCRHEGQWVQAFRLLDRMRKSGIQPNEVTFAAIIQACATASAQRVSSDDFQASQGDQLVVPGPHDKAMKLLRVLKKDPSLPDPNIQVYNAAIRSCAEALDVTRAFSLFEEIQESGLEPNMVTYGELMTACERVADTERVDQVLRMLQENGLEANEILYGAAISCYRRAGQAERAFSLLRRMLNESLEPNAAVFNTVLTAQAEAKGSHSECLERATTVFQILDSAQYKADRPNRQTYNILIRMMASRGNPQGAEFYLGKMRQDGFIPDVDLYTATVSSYERKRQPLKALRLMESMQEDGYDFYEFPVLNLAFKKAVSLVNAVGRGLSAGDVDGVP